MTEDTSVYFAYGANMNRNHMALWCPNSTPLEPATLADHRLIFRFWCDIMETRGQRVVGALYRLGPGDLHWLDQYEDCPRLFEHKPVMVQTQDGRKVAALAYQMKAGHPFAPPDKEYLAVVRQGYLDWGYDPQGLPG